MKRMQSMRSFVDHAKAILLELQIDLQQGCPSTLATAFAMVAFNNLQLACTPKKFRLPEERSKIRMMQALQVAISHYEEPEVKAQIGADQAAAMVRDFLVLLRDENFN